MDVQAVQTFLTTTAIDVGIKILAAIAFWVVGRWIIARVIALMQSAMFRNQIDLQASWNGGFSIMDRLPRFHPWWRPE